MAKHRTSDRDLVGNARRQELRVVRAMITLVLLMPPAVTVFLLSWSAVSEPAPLQTSQSAQQAGVLSPEPPLAAAGAPSGRKLKVRRRVSAQLPASNKLVSFPVATDIPIGMGKSSLLASFRKPDMTTTAVELGQPTETFLYVQADGASQTAVQLRSGKVVAVFEN